MTSNLTGRRPRAACRGDRAQDSSSRPESASQRAADLAATDPWSVVDGDLDDSQPALRSFDLHLNGPSVGPIAHVEGAQRLQPDGSEGSEVGRPRADERVHQSDAQARAEHRVPRMCTLGTVPERARPDHEVRLAGDDRAEKTGELIRMVRVVSVDERDDVDVAGGGDSGEARRAISSPRLGHDARACGCCDCDRRVGRSVVDDDDLARRDSQVLDDAAD